MIWNGFRPSDNASKYGYHIPDNFYALYVLEKTYPKISDRSLKERSKHITNDLKVGLGKYSLTTLPTGQKGYAYEVDGLGHFSLMDDANVPSLLALPLVSSVSFEDTYYQNTRDFILSNKNPYYYSGEVLSGVGSEHTPENYVWPISVLIEGLTYPDTQVKLNRLSLICDTDGKTGQCHEGVHVDDPNRYTRDWFSWANMTFCQLALQILLDK